MSLKTDSNIDFSQPVTELLNEDEIISQLDLITAQSVGQLIVLAKTQSTNSYLLELSQYSSQSGVVCVAESQTKGRGRRGRSWISPAGHNIYLSMIWRFGGDLAELSGLSLAVGLAIVRVLDNYGLSDLSLKWPNDVYCRGQKLAGILVEIADTNANECLVVIGVGLNRWIDAAASDLIDQQWTDLFSLMGKSLPSRNQLIAKIIDQLIKVIDQFEGAGFAGLCDEWGQWDYLLGRQLVLVAGNQQISGTACGVNRSGLLVIKDEQGQQQAYAIGEVLSTRS
jgi:BirA family biotin operon repressor/biotin-[acetyl-CoA-carboxylase] ligase